MQDRADVSEDEVEDEVGPLVDADDVWGQFDDEGGDAGPAAGAGGDVLEMILQTFLEMIMWVLRRLRDWQLAWLKVWNTGPVWREDRRLLAHSVHTKESVSNRVGFRFGAIGIQIA